MLLQRGATLRRQKVLWVLPLALALTLTAWVPLCTRAAAHDLRATSSGSISLRDSVRMHLVQHTGTQNIYEQGTASGTIPGSLTAHIYLYYAEATVSFTSHSKGGTFTGRGTEAYYVSGGTGHFNGTVTISSGTGRYSHARGSRLSLSGIMVRKTYAVSFQVTGSLGT